VREHVRGANLVTSVNLAAGFAALLAVPDHLPLAAGLVLLAAVLDVVDGALARRAGGTAFGAQLDSLADLLCFCVVPAYALAVTMAGGAAVPAAVVAIGFVLAGAWRLARFPLVQQQGHFIGLPTPAAGALLLLASWAPPWLALAGGVLLSTLMISTMRFPSVFAAAAAVRHPRLRLHGRRSLSRVRRIHAVRRRMAQHRPLRRPHRQDPVRRAGSGRRRRAAARAGRLLRGVRRASSRRH
jgi:CDP-diacylglycerol--serine O-phosphatidyltransferase